MPRKRRRFPYARWEDVKHYRTRAEWERYRDSQIEALTLAGVGLLMVVLFLPMFIATFAMA